MIRKKRENLLNELLKREELIFMMDELLAKVDEVMDFILYEFDDVEKDEYMKECLETLFYINYVLYGLQLK